MKLSIITINYNNSQGLEKTLQSVSMQSFKDYEQIVIDGCSVDNSVDVILSFAKKKSINWVSEKDNGVYHAQNKGILRANGDYCLFLNSGDYLVDENVLKSVFLSQPTSDVIWGNLIVVNDDKRIGVLKGSDKVTFLDIYSSQIKHQASFIKRSLFSKYGLYDETLKIVADWEFFFKTVGLNNVSLQYIDINIAYFDNNGISNNNPELCTIERQQVLDKYMPKLMQQDYLLLHKYQGIRKINKSKFGWFFFRILVKLFKHY